MDAFLANRAGRETAQSTLRKDQTFVKQLSEFAGGKGYVMLDQIQMTHMDEFYGAWPDGPRAEGKKLERLKGFFVFGVKRKWIAEKSCERFGSSRGFGCCGLHGSGIESYLRSLR